MMKLLLRAVKQYLTSVFTNEATRPCTRRFVKVDASKSITDAFDLVRIEGDLWRAYSRQIRGTHAI
jgi:hypothetical protein